MQISISVSDETLANGISELQIQNLNHCLAYKYTRNKNIAVTQQVCGLSVGEA